MTYLLENPWEGLAVEQGQAFSPAQSTQRLDPILRATEPASGLAAPTLRDLAESLVFSPGDGRIWLNDERMILLQSACLGVLRRELIESLGIEKARQLLTRIGYASGSRDAELIRRRWPRGDAFRAGPHMHSLEGVVKVTTVRLAMDVDHGSFEGEYLWQDSSEAAQHIAVYGLGSAPVCWMQIGYASGFASALMGKMIIYREVECHAMGAPNCRCIGRPAEDWDNVEEDLTYFTFGELPRAEGPRLPARPKLPAASPAGDPRAMVGISPAFRAARHMLDRVAPTEATVLFTGESGVGKELFSRALHAASRRAAKPFVAVNCAAIPETLIEAELFGVERGAYTGANTSRPGRFERASGGTLFLDEVASMNAVAQSKLLRALQEGEVERVGGTRLIKVDVRVVAASNVDLRERMRAGLFRDDLFFRLNVFPINLPPLRERRDDIPLFMEHFLTLYSEKHRRRITGFTRRAVEALLSYSYPGNVRELQNLIERGVIFADEGGAIDVVHIFRQGETLRTGGFSLGQDGALRSSDDHRASGEHRAAPQPEAPEPSLAARMLDCGLPLRTLENRICSEALARANGNVAQAARLLGLTRAQLDYRLMKNRAPAAEPRLS
jgi:DNA-binding NtrC family response regulator/predicted hydrocarbon binding protein